MVDHIESELRISPAGLMDIESVATYLGVGVDSVRWAKRTGKLPCLKFGKRLKFRKVDVDKFIEAGVETG